MKTQRSHGNNTAGQPRGGNEQAHRHIPIDDIASPARVAARVDTADGIRNSTRINALGNALTNSGFELKRFTAADGHDEYYVVYEGPRHAELFVLLRGQGFKVSSWGRPMEPR